MQSHCIVVPYNASRASREQYIRCSVKGHQRTYPPTPYASKFFMGNIANAWLPIQTYRNTSKCHNFNSKVWIKLPNLSFRPILRAHDVTKCSQIPHINKDSLFSTQCVTFPGLIQHSLDRSPQFLYKLFTPFCSQCIGPWHASFVLSLRLCNGGFGQRILLYWVCLVRHFVV